jgi:predicted amidophosphoribosyltransferase
MDRAGALSGIRTAGGWLLDFALPPRCPGCGEITPAVDLFCGACWGTLEFLGSGCDRCGLALAPGEEGCCLACEQGGSPLNRVRAALGYGEVPRSIAMRLKYGRKIALADHGRTDEATVG